MNDTNNMRELEAAARYYVDAANPDQVRELAQLAMVMHLAYRRNMSAATRDAFNEVLKGMSPEYLLALRAMGLVAQPMIRDKRYRH